MSRSATHRPGVLASRRQQAAAATVVLVVLLAGVNWALSPAHAGRSLRVMVIVPTVWVGLTLWSFSIRRSRAAGAEEGVAIERYFLAALTLLVICLGIPQIVWLGFEVWARLAGQRADLDLERRVLGLAASAVLVVAGNALPKILTPLSMLPLHLSQRVTSARRFAGATFVILGLSTAIAFLVLPTDLARILARLAMIGIVLTLVGAIAWMNAGPAGSRS